MKILIAHYKYYIQGGPERYMFNFMKLAQENGCEVIPFSVNYPTNVPTEYSKYFVGSKDAGGNYDANNHKISYLIKNVYHEFHNKEAYKKIIKLIKDTKPDVLYSLIPGQLTPDIFKAAHKMGIPVVLRISDFRLICGKYSMVRDGHVCEDCLNGKYRNCYKNRCVKNSRILSLLRAKSLEYHRKHKTYKYVDAVMVPPSFTKKLFVRDGFFSENMIFVNSTFVFPKISKPTYIYPKEKNLLCLGRFAYEKGFQYAIEALRFIDNDDVKVIITGDKKDAPSEVLSFIQSNGLEDRVAFVGFLSGQELENTIKNSFAIINPGIWYENMPNTILEAYSFGKPVIASKIGSLEEIVLDKKTGLLFEPKDSYQLAMCVNYLISHPEEYLKMCQNAFKKCQTTFSPEKHWARFLLIIESIKKNWHDLYQYCVTKQQ